MEDHLQPGKPLVVSGAMDNWPAKKLWTPDYFLSHFGKEPVQVYDDLFNLQDIYPLEQYVIEYFNQTEKYLEKIPYIRWYTQFHQKSFPWADTVFEQLQAAWSRPSFLPETHYLLPFVIPPDIFEPNKQPCPAKGLFISAAGAKTRAHTDPWESDGILCQFYGTKLVKLFAQPPSRTLNGFRESYTPNQYDEAFILYPGDILYIPAGCKHEVLTLTDSISLTWNFVHITHGQRFLAYCQSPHSDEDNNVLRFFSSMASI